MLVFQSYGNSENDIPFAVYGVLNRTYYSKLSALPCEWADEPLFVVGAPSEAEYWKGRFSVCEDGSVYLGYQPGVGYSTLTGNSMGFFDDDGTNLAEFGVESYVSLNLEDSSKNTYYQELMFLMSGQDDKFKFQIKESSGPKTVMSITRPNSQINGDSCIIHTEGGFGAIQHTRPDPLGRLKVGVGSVTVDSSAIPSGALELFDDYDGTETIARLVLFRKDDDDITLRVGGYINGSYITFPLTFHYDSDGTKKLYFAGSLVHSI